jgi:dTDP-4-amino-4,6-dideoxygalactose transaminase
MSNVPSAAGMLEQAHELREELVAAATRVIDSGWYVLGPEVEQFENEFAQWSGVNYAIGVASGTDALHLALRALGLGPGDEVIIPSNALPTAYGVAHAGVRIRFADVRECDYCIDPEHVAQLINDRTRAIIAVHLYGHPADVPALREVVDGRDIHIVEDCAQAHGASLNGSSVGTMGDIAAWSMYPTKNMGAYGDAGAVTTRDSAVAARVRSLRMYGEVERYRSTEIGLNSRLDEMQAALLRVKLRHVDGAVGKRQVVATWYDEAISPELPLQTPPVLPGVIHARHLYPVRIENRNAVQEKLIRAGYPIAVHYPVGAHDQPCFADWRDASLPITEKLGAELMSLPMHPFVAKDQVDGVVSAISDAVGMRLVDA